MIETRKYFKFLCERHNKNDVWLCLYKSNAYLPYLDATNRICIRQGPPLTSIIISPCVSNFLNLRKTRLSHFHVPIMHQHKCKLFSKLFCYQNICVGRSIVNNAFGEVDKFVSPNDYFKRELIRSIGGRRMSLSSMPCIPRALSGAIIITQTN